MDEQPKSQQRTSQLQRYERYLAYTAAQAPQDLPVLSERRFREYWQQMRDAQITRGGMAPAERDAYESRVFAGIVEWVASARPPYKPQKPRKTLTAQDLHAHINPLAQLLQEIERLYTENLAQVVAELKDYLGRDRARYSPTLMAEAGIKVEQWHTHLVKLLRDFIAMSQGK